MSQMDQLAQSYRDSSKVASSGADCVDKVYAARFEGHLKMLNGRALQGCGRQFVSLIATVDE